MPTWTVRFDLKLDFGDERLSSALLESAALARAIHGFPLPPLARERLNRLNIVRAVRGTTGIEGSRLTEAEVGTILGAARGPVLAAGREREEAEARNAAQVMKSIAEILSRDGSAPLTEAAICRIHEMTTIGIEYETNVPGQYRSHAVSAGDYVPPRTNSEVRELMGKFIEWLNSPPASVWPPIARAIAAHFYFISIHPFGDGNGRTARAIESYLLYQARVNALGFYSLANFYYRNRATYIEKLDEVRFGTGENLTPFVTFAVRGLLEELQTAFAEVHAETTLIAFRDYARSQLEQTGKLGTPAGARMQQFLSLLGAERVPVAALKRWGDPLAKPFLKVSDKTLSRDLQFLEKNQLIGREGGYVWARLDVMEQFTL